MPNILRRSFVERETFDPSNARHMASFDTFVKTGNWGDVQFFSELPYNEVPMTVLMKFAEHQRNVKREDTGERNARLAAIEGLVRVGPSPSPSAERVIRHEALNRANAILMERLKEEIA